MFFEEARELLISLEEGLMDLERRQGDRAHLDKTFRAAHSLKGAAAMVGLESIARFTHGIEAVLEKIRGGLAGGRFRHHHDAPGVARPPGGDGRGGSGRLADPGLGGPEPAARPTCSAASRRARPPAPPRLPGSGPGASAPPPPAGSPPARPGADRSAAARRSRRAAGGSARGRPAATESSAVPQAERRTEASRPSQGAAGARRGRWSPGRALPHARIGVAGRRGRRAGGCPATFYRITLSPGPDTLRRGVNPLGVLDELRELGESTLTTDPDLVPPLDEIDPERCYLNWTITRQDRGRPRAAADVFLFVSEDSTVQVESARRRRHVRDAAVGPRLRRPGRHDVGGQPPPRAARPRHEPGRAGRAVARAGGRCPHRRPSTAPRRAGTPRRRLPGHRPPGGGLSPFPAARPHARIRVDAQQLDDLVGLAGELAVLSDNLQGLREDPRLAPWLHALESLAAGQPADPRHDAGPADGPGR